MRKIFVLLTIITTISLAGYAQLKNGKVSGTVIDGNTKTIESATITLQRAKDSSVAKISVADKTGNYLFENVAEGKYFVSITAVGHQKGLSEVFELTTANAAVTLKTIELIPAATSIAGVTVNAKKPLIEQKPGKTIINVDASPTNAGLNVLEILEKSPGVSVDNDGNISVKGKQGVLVLIDGKQTYMSGTDLANLLKNMPSSSLDQLEIMTNPPAKYDAAGNSGIINIKTKKSVIKGMNGNLNLGYSQGVYGRTNNGINLNYRNNKINIFGGYNAGTWAGFNKLWIDRKLDGVRYSSSDQFSKFTFNGVYHTLKAGMDYSFSKKDILGFVVNANFNNGNEDPRSTSNLRDLSGNIDSILRSSSVNRNVFAGVTTNLNYKHTFDSTGREISADFDYAAYNSRNRSRLLTQGYNKSDVEAGDAVTLRGILPSNIDIYTFKVDYVHPFKSGLRLEAGVKMTYVTTDNKVDYYRSIGSGDFHFDANRSNHFEYTENVNAAYAIFSKTINKKWNLNLGLRAENTNAKGHQYTPDSIFKRNYVNLFPNLGVGYDMSEKHQFNFSYSRRITRPNYDALNPFVFFLDSLTYNQGNPYLQPQFTNNFEFSHTFNRFLTTTINYTRTTDIIAELLKQEGKITYQTRENFSKMQQWGIAVMINREIMKGWNTSFYVNVFNNHFEGIYQFAPVDIQFTSFMGNLTNSFSLGKGWNAEVSGWYRSKATEGLLVAKQMWAVNSAISKQVLKKKATIKAGIRDIFWTQRFRGYADYGNVDVNIANKRDSRQFNLSFTYRFGKTNIAPARRKTGGADDEQSRVNTGGN
ncbi:MAG: TonB-dependent receptor [Chitinophagaceae bacterium]